MKKLTPLYKKLALVLVILAITLAAVPLSAASAAALNGAATPPASTPDYPRVERAWAREQSIYQRQGNRLSKADGFIARVQNLLNKATEKGLDVTPVQVALDAFSAVIPVAETAHAQGEVIITSHAGFGANGEVTDRATAIQTVKSLAQVLKDTHSAMNGTGKALLQAVLNFRQEHSNPTPTQTQP